MMTVRFGPDEGTDWPEYPARTPRPPEPDWDPDTDTAWTQQIDDAFDDSDGPEQR